MHNWHIHISFNPEKADKDGLYYGYEIKTENTIYASQLRKYADFARKFYHKGEKQSKEKSGNFLLLFGFIILIIIGVKKNG